MTYETIQKLVKASGVTAGELILVHFWGDDDSKEIANQFVTAVASLGASPLFLQQSRRINRELFSAAKEGCFGESYFAALPQFDAVLDVFAYQPVILGSEIEAEAFARYRAYMARLFDVLMRCKRFTQIRIPTQENAAESGLAADEYIRRMDDAYAIDYEAVRRKCEATRAGFDGVQAVTLHTENGCAMQFDLTGRTWQTDAGDGDLPCGEIYVAPVEAQTNGTAFFSQLYLDGTRYENVTLTVENGLLVNCSSRAVMDYFAAQPEENRVVCELGLGMNPNVTDLCGYTLLDEKMAGTFHIALGANTFFGGKNEASSHIDFVGQGELEARI